MPRIESNRARTARRVPRSWWTVATLSLLIALYGANYALRGEKAFVGELAASFSKWPWLVIGHAAFGTLALLSGPWQFRRDLLARRRQLHRVLGRIYVIAALGTGATGLFMAARSYGGVNTHVAFGLLAVLTMATTTTGLSRILAGDVPSHRAWMLRSFALIFAGVMLRIEQPVLMALHGGEFAPAYAIVAWLSWVPNLAWAEWWIRRRASVPVPQMARAAA